MVEIPATKPICVGYTAAALKDVYIRVHLCTSVFVIIVPATSPQS
ncbi:hypothetical protein [Fischerella sp. JS2]|nr:hypothetical protein [Fischerella sp. JS2]